MDGRDTLPTSGAGYMEQLQQHMRIIGVGKVASVGTVPTADGGTRTRLAAIGPVPLSVDAGTATIAPGTVAFA